MQLQSEDFNKNSKSREFNQRIRDVEKHISEVEQEIERIKQQLSHSELKLNKSYIDNLNKSYSSEYESAKVEENKGWGDYILTLIISLLVIGIIMV